MKAVLVALVLGIACSVLQAQVLDSDRRHEKAAIRSDHARSVERQTSEGTFKLDRVRPDHTRGSAPSPAEQQQRQLYEQRQPRQR